MDRSEEWFTVDEVVARYKLGSKETLYGMRARGRGPRGYLFGRELRFRASDLAAWEESRCAA